MYMTSQSKTKRRKWPWIVAAVFVFFYLVGCNERENVEPVTSQAPLGQKELVAEELEESEVVEELPEEPDAPVVEWIAHEFTVFKDEDISFSNRTRRRVTVVAPTALTPEDRIATLVEAALQSWQKHHSQYIALFLLPFESGPTIARIDYAPDKCGISGEDCSNKVWTDAHASDALFTPEQEQIYLAWEDNRDSFKEIDDDFGFEVVNEGRLKAFLAKRFNSTPEDISKAYLNVTVSSVIQQEMTIPNDLELKGQLSKQEQKEGEAVACRANLQCWGDENSTAASVYCPDHIERLAKYDYEWTDGWLGAKFSRFSWKDRQNGVVTYVGDQIKFQNAYGAWIHHTYYCDWDPSKKKVLEVRAVAGRL